MIVKKVIAARSQRHYKSRRVLDEISAKFRLSRRELTLHYMTHMTLQISPSSRRDFVNPDEISFTSVRSRRDLRDITNLAEISSGLTRSRRDLCHLGEISLISPRSRRALVYLTEISATIQISPRSRRGLVNLGEISSISPRSRLNFCTGSLLVFRRLSRVKMPLKSHSSV